MKLWITIVLAVFLAAVCASCERTETAVDLYKKVKEDAKQKAQQAQDEAQRIMKEKAKDALSPKKTGEEENEGEDKD